MALDLAFGTAAITGLSVLTYRAGRWIGLKPAAPKTIFLGGMIAIAVAFSYLLSGKLFWARVFPTAAVIYWSNLMPVLLSLIAGLASTSNLFSSWNRATTVGMFLLLTIGYIVSPVARPILMPAKTAATSTWNNNICLQSHGATCAPSAAATLLQSASIGVGESEMVEACLTSQHGTEPLGLFRGLAIASSHRSSRPRVAATDPARWPELGQLPNVALISFPGTNTHADDVGPSSLSRIFGPSRDGHAIVVLGKTDSGRWMIADPAFGRTTWTDSEFRSRFSGDAIFLDR